MFGGVGLVLGVSAAREDQKISVFRLVVGLVAIFGVFGHGEDKYILRGKRCVTGGCNQCQVERSI